MSAKSKTEAEKVLRHAMSDADRGLVFDAGTLTVEEYLGRWIKDSVQDTVRPTTFERYEQIVRTHIVPALGRVKLKPLLKRATLPQVRFHDLRHTCATLLLSENVNPKVVSEMLGHASIAMTLDTYSHVLPTMQESAAAMEDALS